MPTHDAAVEFGPNTFGSQQPKQECRHDQSGRTLGQCLANSHQHSEHLGHRFAIGNELIDRLQDRQAFCHHVEIAEHPARRIDRLDLIHDVEIRAPVDLYRHMRQRLEATTELRMSLANSLRDGSNLAVLARQHDHDSIGFAELVRANDDRFVAIEAARHSITPPKRR